MKTLDALFRDTFLYINHIETFAELGSSDKEVNLKLISIITAANEKLAQRYGVKREPVG